MKVDGLKTILSHVNLALIFKQKMELHYCDAVQKTCYSCFRHQVPIRSVSEVIKIVGWLGCDLKPIPRVSTVVTVSEMKTSGLKKALEGMTTSEFINLALDTTRTSI